LLDLLLAKRHSKTFKMTIKVTLPDEFFMRYVDNMMGDYRADLEKKTFTGSGETSYLDAVRYSAAIMWNAYKRQDDDAATTSVFNTIDVIALSLHPKSKVKNMGITNACKLALVEIEMQKFQNLFLLDSDIFYNIYDCLKAATSNTMSASYPAQMCLMSWFLCMVSKMTGVRIPGNKELLVGGRIIKEKTYIRWYFQTVTTITAAMSEENNWNNLAQCSILKEMHRDLNQMIRKYLGQE